MLSRCSDQPFDINNEKEKKKDCFLEGQFFSPYSLPLCTMEGQSSPSALCNWNVFVREEGTRSGVKLFKARYLSSCLPIFVSHSSTECAILVGISGVGLIG